MAMEPEPFEGLWRDSRDPARLQLGHRGGTGLPLFLLPGIEGDARCFVALQRISDRRPVFAFDLPTVLLPPPFGSLQELAQGLLSRIELPRFFVLGQSFGGLLARSMAEQAPHRVAGLIALGTLPARHLLPTTIDKQARLLRWLPDPLFRLAYRNRIALRMTEEGISPSLQEPLLDKLPDRMTLRSRLSAIREWGLGPAPRVPTLWLRGQLDTEAPWSVAEAQTLLPSAGVETIPGGHRAHLTHATALQAIVEHFIQPLR